MNQQLVPTVAGELAQATTALALERRRCEQLKKTLNSRMSLLKMVSRMVPRANLASLLGRKDFAGVISSFLGIRDVLMLKVANKSIAKILTGRPELYENADVYQFNSRYPEQYTLQFCIMLLRERAALRNLRLAFSVDEWCVPRKYFIVPASYSTTSMIALYSPLSHWPLVGPPYLSPRVPVA